MGSQKSDYLIEHEDYANWDINTGDETVHARRIPGRFRNIKWLISSILLIPFFLTPYLSWHGNQAIYFDIPARKFHLFDITIWPQDLIILALLMLFAFILLFAMTAIAGRIFCGTMCPQTLWTDLMTLTERWAEGSARQRIKLESMPWNAKKIRKKAFKHFMWITICTVTSVTFLGYFSGIYDAWSGLFTLSYNIYEWLSFFIVFTLFYVNTGFVREQVCNWICPYARIQAVMTDKDTITTTYDYHRGEKRGPMKKGKVDESLGDCVDCNLCVSVCPTGVDIREGNQIGCINCGLCIDACDDIMTKVGRPKGLIRFMSYHELENNSETKNRFLRPRPIFYMFITTATFIAIMYGLLFKSDIDMNVNHERSPTYTLMSDRTIQNAYHVIILNKAENAATFTLKASGIDGITTNFGNKKLQLTSGQAKKITLRIKIPQKKLINERQSITLVLQSTDNPELSKTYESMFFGPRK
ncbi:MAG: cytochrome c oxidase accessory protein CcoG [Ghiorsea sp.]|nr:cytochrome c oxidase accessory protein CcoG [Ghiorsea sp.]